jgi:hypothetical protein
MSHWPQPCILSFYPDVLNYVIIKYFFFHLLLEFELNHYIIFKSLGVCKYVLLNPPKFCVYCFFL